MQSRPLANGTTGVTLLAALLLLAAGCAGKIPGTSGSSAACGNQCASTSCPEGTHCTLTGNCTPLCQIDPLSPR
jgi:hypothetical protein